MRDQTTDPLHLARRIVEAEAEGCPSPAADWLARLKARPDIGLPGATNDELLRHILPEREPDDLRREMFPEIFGPRA